MSLAIFTAFWLGLLTSVSPCPLASNIAAISFISRDAGNQAKVFGAGLCYALGRTIAYVAVAMLVLAGLLTGSELSRFLQQYLNQILGPVLILTGMLLLGWIGGTASLNLAGDRIQKQVAKGSLLWALLLGMLFALSFCPVSAGLYFGGLLPLAAAQGSRLLLPAIFGLGTAVPVLFFAFLIAFAAGKISLWFNRLSQIEKLVRRATGIVFVLAGIYYCLVHIYGIRLLV
jgi:cytochrome c biogenesis protein CcdA